MKEKSLEIAFRIVFRMLSNYHRMDVNHCLRPVLLLPKKMPQRHRELARNIFAGRTNVRRSWLSACKVPVPTA